MISGFFTTIQNDFSIINDAINDKTSSNNSVDDETVFKTRTAAFRLVGAGVMGIGLVIAFVALPILSSGLNIILLALGVILFVTGHDLFMLAQNFENNYLATVRPYTPTPVKEDLDKVLADLESGTIIWPFLVKTRDYWRPNLISTFTGINYVIA